MPQGADGAAEQTVSADGVVMADAYGPVYGLLGAAAGLLIGVLLGLFFARQRYQTEIVHQGRIIQSGRQQNEELQQLLEGTQSQLEDVGRERDAALRVSEDHEQQMNALHDALRREQERLRENQGKLKATVVQNKQLHQSLADAYAVAEKLHADAQLSDRRAVAADARVPVERRHTVFLDGNTSSGKTTLAQHLTNPLATPEDLRVQVASAIPREYTPLPLCIEDGQNGRVLHTLAFYDTVGEKPQVWTEAVLAHPHRGAGTGRAVSLLIWDLSRPRAVNMEYLSSWRIKVTYGLPPVRGVIGRVVIMFNKTDHPDASVDEISELESFLRDELFAVPVLDDPPELYFCSGSAVTGQGLHACLGNLIRALELEDHFDDAGA